MANPLVSIITPTFNQAQFIEQTIRSVLEQNYTPLEYIIVDGGSTDGTLDILKRYGDRLRWISEPDGGQADAINKGFHMASGEIMAWLNSDDLYMPNAISTVVEHFQKRPDIAFIYGDALALDRDGKSYGVRVHVKQTDFEMLVHQGDYLVQPAAFWRRQLWETTGDLDKSLHYTLDYEYWMRAAERYPFLYIPVCLAQERLYGGAKTFKGSLQRIEEIEQVARQHGGDDLPYGFHGEAAAAYTVEAMKSAVTGKFRQASRYFRRARSYHPPRGLYLRYLGVMTLFGYGGISWMWLRLNRLRQNRKRQTVVPDTAT